MFSVVLIPRITNNTPAHSLADMHCTTVMWQNYFHHMHCSDKFFSLRIKFCFVSIFLLIIFDSVLGSQKLFLVRFPLLAIKRN